MQTTMCTIGSRSMTFYLSGRKSIKVGEWFNVETLLTFKGCVSVVKANHKLEPLTKEVPMLLSRFYMNQVDMNV